MKIKILLILSIITFQVKGQNKNTITGNIIDKDTKEALQSATIIYQNKSIGTTSDKNGLFTLTLSSARESDSIFISYMGYETIRTTVLKCKNTKIHELKPFINELIEVTIASKKLNLKKFIKEVITGYNKNKRKNAHIAIAHYREKAKENNQFIMFMESIGYSVFADTPANTAPLSNYNFFYENTKSHVVNPKWTKYKRAVLNVQKVAPGGGANLNIFRSLELYGVLSNKYYKKYNYKKDSTYYIQNNPVYRIRFDGNNAKGSIHVYADTKQILKVECSTTKYWSTAFHKRVDAQIKIQFNYFEKVPFVSEITASYQHKNLEYQNSFEVLVQKFNNFDLSKEEYWSMNGYDKNPYVEYIPKNWKTTIEPDKDYDKIAADLASNPASLEKQFENSSGRWFFPNKETNKLAVSKIKQLKEKF
ncbi:carboxypeptidase-like regulatory domain-containing protein [Snuella lapsa]|uniref:Carboxypeptidase-like regulatory domain-containing protein n=1 Tax=Snuella lapsa TaxID=870481 RepID=A0ABP6XKB0_9FLAO